LRLALAVTRRWLALPRPRCRTESSTQWVALSDGTRLATVVVRPAGPQWGAVPSVLVRSADPIDAGMSRLLVHLVAERGYAVVFQTCRGRGDSEGRFVPFIHEAQDGMEAMDWVAEQPWCDGRLALAGSDYAGFTAWAACAGADPRVGALVVGFASRDPYGWLHAGGARQLELMLHFGVGIGETARVAPRRLDLERAARFRPLREADRVAWRRTDWFRDWLDHPERDAFWESLSPALPPTPPPTLMIAGWYDPALGAQLRDYADVAATAREVGAVAPELVVGPWGATRTARGERSRKAGRGATGVPATLEFLDRHLRDAHGGGAPVRVYVRGADVWREASAWPPPEAEVRTFHLRSGGNARGLRGDGRLTEQSADPNEPPDGFVYDPADAVPSCGGAALAARAGPVDQRGVESRGDVLCYTGDPLAADLDIVGPVRVELFAASDAPDTDFTAKLVEVAEDGTASNLCDGIARCRYRTGRERDWLESDRIEPVEIDLWAASCRVHAGRQLRVEISSSSFPRFDRNPNNRAEPARAKETDLAPAQQTIYHDADHPSRLILHTLPH